jgi:MbtH protein
MRDEEEDTRTYAVVVNHEEQYSIWFADREPPLGWKRCGKAGPKAECLDWVKDVWTDMRPLSLRKRMEEAKKNPPAPPPAPPPPPRHPLGKNELVERLEGAQAVQAGVRPEPLLEFFKQQVDRGYIFMKFVETGTELGIRMASSECDLSGCDWQKGSGVAKFVGDLILNYNRVRYRGDLDLQTLRGTGRLEFISETKPGEGLERPS